MKKPGSKRKPQRPRSSDKPAPSKLNQVTAEEFEREGLGVAPKE